MKIECPSCKKSGQVDDSKVPDSGVYATCPQCNNKFLVKHEVPKDFEFEPVEQPIPTVTNITPPVKLQQPSPPLQTTPFTKPSQSAQPEAESKKSFGKVSAFFISLLITITINMAIHAPFIYITGSKMHMGPLSLINTIAFIISFSLLYKRRLPIITVVSAIGGYVIVVIVGVLILHLWSKSSLAPVSTTALDAQISPSPAGFTIDNPPPQIKKVYSPGWTVVMSNPDLISYIDNSTIRRSGNSTITYKTKVTFMGSDEPAESQDTIEADCNEIKTKSLESSIKMRDGSVNPSRVSSDWNFQLPGSKGHSVVVDACAIAKEK